MNRSYTSFNQNEVNALEQPMFFGEGVNVARYDQQRYKVFESLTEKQLAFFWRPEEVDLSLDRRDYMEMPPHERHIFISNLKYQILLDSVQGRSPNMALLPVVSLPELETWIETWSFSETIHSRSYTHIIRNLVSNPGEIFDTIVGDPEIAKRAASVTKTYDSFILYVQSVQCGAEVFNEYTAYLKLIKVLLNIYILEGIRFYVSFACSFAFGERKTMEGNAKIIKLIARDEALHKKGTLAMLVAIRDGKEGTVAQQAYNDLFDNGVFASAFEDAKQQESDWADYLFKDGSMIGLNAEILKEYVSHITNKRRAQLKESESDGSHNPLPWMNTWLVSENVQVAPQESENSAYLTGQVDNDLADADFGAFKL